MRASGVNAAIARHREAGTKKLRVISIVRIWVARITGFYCNTNILNQISGHTLHNY